MAADSFRWGILGTGNIARQFARDLAALPGHEIAAVASRGRDTAEAFCQAHGGAALAGYGALLGREDVDAVYLSLPNHLHAEWAIRCLEAGRHVLCEKPLAMSLPEARAMFSAARAAGRTLIEAFMYRTHPQTAAILAAVRGGEIGRLTHIRTSFCFHLRKTAGNIRMDPAMGGGALMDVGCYCISFSMLLAESPVRDMRAISRLHEGGVDMMTSGLLAFENGVQATFTCGMDAQTDNTAVISGTEGYITVAWPWKPTNQTAGFTIARGIPPKQDLKPGEEAIAPPPRFVEARADVPLFALEARAFAAACRGEVAPFMPEAESLALAEAMDRARESAR
jgi:predicted dehydrogenase